MNTLEFLRRVLPESGWYCVGVALPNSKFKHKFSQSLEEVAEYSKRISAGGYDVYYAVSSFKDANSRRQHNVQETRIFFIDVDVGKDRNSYANKREALTAVLEFVQRNQLPKPMIVSSGKGFHIYWALKTPLSFYEWKPRAEALKALAIAQGLIIDPAVPGDSARVLRAPGTLHVGSGSTVKVVVPAEAIDLSEFSIAPAPPMANKPRGLLSNLKVSSDFPPAVADIVASKCKQINWAISNQSEVEEPFWYALLGIAAFTQNPEDTAIAWSSNHPDFSEQQTINKLEQWKAKADGPSTCARFEALRPSGCKGCPFQGKITSPCRLGAQFQEVGTDPDAPDTSVTSVPVPRPFKRTARGIAYTIEDTDVDVCPFDIYPVSYGRDEGLGYEVVRFNWKRPHVGWTPLVMRQALLTEGHRDFAAACADQGIVLPSKKQTEVFQLMLRAYMEELKKIRSLTNLYTTMGWKEDHDQFVIGEYVIRPEGQSVIEERSTLAANASRNSGDMFGVSGSLDTWVNATSILEKAAMPWHMFALGVGFSAPLYAFGGLKGLTISLYGETGGGKTLIQYWIQSIYGNPDRLHFAAKYTQNTLFSRLGSYSNLPMTIDEATMLQDKEVGDFLYWVSQGRDKARLNRNSEERDAKTWATPVVISTNKSIQAKLISSGLDTDAQMARLLEVTIPPHTLFSKDSTVGKKIYHHLMKNYGYAGRAFLRHLVGLGPDKLRTLVEEHAEEFYKTYNAKFAGHERFWEQAVILADLGSKIAQDLSLIKYDYTAGTRWVLDQLGVLRDSMNEIKLDAFDLLGQYLNEVANATVTVTQTANNPPMCDHTRLPRGDVRARIQLWRKDGSTNFTRGVLLVDRTHLRRWLSSGGHDYKAFQKEISVSNADASPRGFKGYLAKDTPIKLPQSYVLGFDLAHPKLEGMLNDISEAYDQRAFSKLKLV
jgi:hypothetical protein